ncbi:MAG: DUF1707 domain-containing protein [Acidipropionibacterium sp.]|jgi:hypothetical protein|nr:DUF1707 domain-containing protein [Acidipropionibacterium sp.]
MDPNMRIGDSERDAAVGALRDHHVAGRLTAEEFSERMETALAAHTQGDLDALFQDLPETPPPAAPASSTTSTAVEKRQSGQLSPAQRKALDVAAALTWPAALVFCFATGWQWWWVMLIPIFVMPALTGHSGHHRSDHRKKRDEDD